MTKLEAVNHVLQEAGDRPVGKLETATASNASLAEMTLDTEEQLVQSKGWHYNTLIGYEITPDASGNVNSPAGTFQIDTDAESFYADAAQVGARLYDRENNTFAWTDSLKTKVVVRMEWGCIPPPIQHYIAACAAARFNRRWGADRARQPILERECRSTRVDAMRYDCEQKDVNILDTAEVRRVLGNRFGASSSDFDGSGVPIGMPND